MTNCEIKRFVACEFVEGHSWTDEIKTTSNNPMKERYIRKDHLIYVHILSVDNYIFLDKGGLYHKNILLHLGVSQVGVFFFTMPVVL